jgi:glycosyltransferase involved in cell wall biosynthesis
MDAIFVHCHSMKENFIGLGAAAEKIHMVPYGVDQHFFSPQKNVQQEPNLIFSVGEPRSRNYGMLFKAVTGLPVFLKVAAGGSWYAREKNRRLSAFLPENIQRMDHLSLRQMRNLYAQAQFVILPVKDLVYSAGATAALEAACMERAVIATRSKGISDYVIDGETGILVQPNDEGEMRAAIQHLIDHPEEARRLGRNGRRFVEKERNLDLYVDRLAGLLRSYHRE